VSAIACGGFFMLVVKAVGVRGTSIGTRSRPFFFVPGRGDPLPPIALFRVRLKGPDDGPALPHWLPRALGPSPGVELRPAQ